MDLAYLRNIGLPLCKESVCNERHRPGNFFLSIPITTPLLLEAFSSVQAALYNCDSRLVEALTDPAAAHITLWTLSLTTPEEEELAVSILEEVASSLPLTLPCVLDLCTIQHFHDRVLFFSVAAGTDRDSLFKLASALRDAFTKRGMFDDNDQDDFEPHVTVAKVSLLGKKARRDLKHFPATLYDSLKEVSAGVQSPICVKLCRVSGRKQGEYYPVRYELQL